jgi:DEAD/DEAH box helicase domain-containing protein
VPDLWLHQVEAIEHLRRGHHVVVATGTGSGKSLCYQLPLAEALLDPIRPSTALVIGPTKALAHDQIRALSAYDFPGVRAAVYDGDASANERTYARNQANVVFTNPEMLHGGLLPNHARWAPFLMRLRLVVIDEMHVFRGVFGTHLAHVLRRLRRLCEHHGTRPSFVLCSATIGDPATLAQALCGAPVEAVTNDTATKGARTIALLQPPTDPLSGSRFSANSETALLTAALVRADHRVIAFCRGRRATEVVAAEVQRRTPSLAQLVRAYRAGYLADERREIEDALANGDLRAVVTTSALELGVDIGSLDACVINGFPGTIASTWQQIGRVGRNGQPSLAVVVAGDDQLDQWLVRHPRALFERPPERAVINTTNPFIARPHLACAAFERPLGHTDERWWGDDTLADGVRDLVHDDLLAIRRPHRFATPRAMWSGKGVPAPRVGLRSGAGGEVKIRLPDDTLVGTVDATRATNAVHPGAVYLHQGRPYEVRSLDLDARVAVVMPANGDTYTQARSDVDIRVVHTEQRRAVGPAMLHLGEVEVSSQVTGFQRKDLATRRVLETTPLDLPATRLRTRSFWLTFDDATIRHARIGAIDLPGALHAAEHAAIGMLPLFTICDRWDVGGVSTARHEDTGAPTVFIYDGYPGGAGIAELGWHAADELFDATHDAIAGCACSAGCPSCIQSPKCGNGNEPLDKAAAVDLLGYILGKHVIDLRDASSRVPAA